MTADGCVGEGGAPIDVRQAHQLGVTRANSALEGIQTLQNRGDTGQSRNLRHRRGGGEQMRQMCGQRRDSVAES